MKKWLWSSVIVIVVLVLIGCSKLFEVQITNPYIIEGVVLDIDENGGALISQKEDLVWADLNQSYDDWMEGNYDLIHVSHLEGAQIGMRVSITLKGGIAESYPARATATQYQAIGMIELEDQSTSQLVIQPVEPYQEELLNMFPKTIGLMQVFNGYAEYGHVQKLIKVEEKGSLFELTFEGRMMDGIGDYESRQFEIIYQIDHQSVIEKISNQDCYNRLKDEALLNSIIPNKVLLKTPLEVGNSWIETFPYEGNDYTAKTTIVRAEVNDEGKMEYETLTTVEGMTDFYDNTYKESRVFVQGSGMVSFSNLFSFDEVGIEYNSSEQSEDLYMFGYGLTNQEIRAQ